MSNRGLTKTYKTGGAPVARRRIVKFSADFTVAQASAAGDDLIGISDQAADAPPNGRCDVNRDGLAEVLFGGTVARGKPVTADANGKAVLCDPAAGTSARFVGFAEVSAVSGDIGDVFISPGVLTKPV